MFSWQHGFAWATILGVPLKSAFEVAPDGDGYVATVEYSTISGWVGGWWRSFERVPTLAEQDESRRNRLRAIRMSRAVSCRAAPDGPHENDDGRCVTCGMRA